MGDQDTVVGDRDAGLFGLVDAVLHLAAVKHAGAAVYDHAKGREVQRIRAAAGEYELDILAGVLSDPPRKLDRPDVITLPMMRAAFGDEDFVSIHE